METIFQAIGQYGFPVVIALVVLWYCVRMTDTHRDETKELTTAINNNNVALAELRAMITTLLDEIRKDKDS